MEEWGNNEEARRRSFVASPNKGFIIVSLEWITMRLEMLDWGY
jgi:hypothetical protein